MSKLNKLLLSASFISLGAFWSGDTVAAAGNVTAAVVTELPYISSNVLSFPTMQTSYFRKVVSTLVDTLKTDVLATTLTPAGATIAQAPSASYVQMNTASTVRLPIGDPQFDFTASEWVSWQITSFLIESGLVPAGTPVTTEIPTSSTFSSVVSAPTPSSASIYVGAFEEILQLHKTGSLAVLDSVSWSNATSTLVGRLFKIQVKSPNVLPGGNSILYKITLFSPNPSYTAAS